MLSHNNDLGQLRRRWADLFTRHRTVHECISQQTIPLHSTVRAIQPPQNIRNLPSRYNNNHIAVLSSIQTKSYMSITCHNKSPTFTRLPNQLIEILNNLFT